MSQFATVSPGRRSLLRGGAALGLSLVLPSLRGEPAVLEDTHPFTVHDRDWLDASRARPVPVRLYLPETTTAASAVPAVVFSHGIGGSRAGYSYLGRYLAGHGVASLHLQHVGSDRSLWTGNPLTLIGRLQQAAHETEALARVQDLHFALDQMLTEPAWAGRMDPARLVAAGHSYGANTAMLATGARVQREGRPLALRDERLKAALLLSSPPFYGEPDQSAVLGGVTVASLHVTTTDDVINIPGYDSPATDRIAVFQAMGGPRKALAVFEGGSHSIFTDRLGTGGPELNARIKQATQELALDFVLETFGSGARLAAWRERYRPLLARFEQRAAPV